MKKTLFLLPLAALAFAACSSDDSAGQQAVQSQSSELRIFPQVGGTRGTLETTASIDEFNVIVQGLFAESATTAASSSTWTKTVTKSEGAWGMTAPSLYWGDATTSATFMAYANQGAATYSNGVLTGFTVGTDNAAQADLVVAYNSGTKTDFAAGVPLHFQHALSQVIVKANYTYDETYVSTNPDLTIKVEGFEIVNVNNKGNLTLPTASTASSYAASWALTGAATTYGDRYSTPITLSSTAVAIDNSGANGPMLLIPQQVAASTDYATSDTPTGSYLMVKVDIDYVTAQGGKTNVYPAHQGEEEESGAENKYAWVAIPLNIDWTAGYKYTYTLNFSNTAVGAVPKDQPNTEEGEDDATDNPGVNPEDPIVEEVKTPLTFTVTVEDTWQEANSNVNM